MRTTIGGLQVHLPTADRSGREFENALSVGLRAVDPTPLEVMLQRVWISSVRQAVRNGVVSGFERARGGLAACMQISWKPPFRRKQRCQLLVFTVSDLRVGTVGAKPQLVLEPRATFALYWLGLDGLPLQVDTVTAVPEGTRGVSELSELDLIHALTEAVRGSQRFKSLRGASIGNVFPMPATIGDAHHVDQVETKAGI